MAKKSISRCKKRRHKKKTVSVTHVPLCALGAVIEEKQLFAPIHQQVFISQKQLDYRPTDKRVFTMLGIVAGSESVYEINTVLRPNKTLLRAFGYRKCADQSVIQTTINAATHINVCELSDAIDDIFQQHNCIGLCADDAQSPSKLVTIDIDLSALPISKTAQGAEKGYVAKKKNQYTRQLARVIIPSTQEIVTQQLYSGSTKSLAVFKEMVDSIEQSLQLKDKTKRQSIKLRLDAGFGTDKNINFALWRGYQILVKVYSWKRVNKLVKSVKHWIAVPSAADNTPREAGWVTMPHRYGRKTVAVAVRTPTKKGTYSYSVVVSTDTQASLATIVTDYDKRSGVPESTFCQDYQGLKLRRRRKNGFVAQQVLLLLSQLAHNLVIWMKQWLSNAVVSTLMMGETQPKTKRIKQAMLTHKTLDERGIKRFLRQILWLSGRVVFKGSRIVGIILNPLYPLIDRIIIALQAFLLPYQISVSLDKRE